MKTSAGPKLPSDQPYPLPMNIPVEFEVKFKDPFSLVASISTDWKFGDDPPVTKWKNTTIYHTFQKEGQYSLWVTIRVNTTFLGTKSFHPIEKNLYIKGWYNVHALSGLKIIFLHSPVKITGQIHFSSDILHFWLVNVIFHNLFAL